MKLSVLKKNQLIQEIDLGREVLKFDYNNSEFLIGRSNDCHIVLDDKQISREFAKIIHSAGVWSLLKISNDSVDLKVNGEVVGKKELYKDDIITIGDFQILVVELSKNKTSLDENTKVEKLELNSKVNKEVTVARKLDATAEILSSEITKEIVSENITGELSNDLVENEEVQSLGFEDESLENIEEEFSDEPNIDIESNGEVVESENNDSAYSLENIDEGSGEDGTKVYQSFAAIHLELFGDRAPFDKFIIDREKIFIGRDPAKCQIILNDPEVSSIHAVLIKNNVSLSIEDLNSANGTLLNGSRINKSNLVHNDEFVIGSVSFTVKFRSEFLQDENSRLMPVDENQSIEVEEVLEVPVEDEDEIDEYGEVKKDDVVEKSIIKRILKNEDSRKKAIYALVGLVLVWVLFDEDKPAENKPIEKKKDSKQVASNKYVPKAGSSKKVKLTKEQEIKFSEIFQIGKNHFDNGRYREALEEFDKITVVDPYFHPSLPDLVATSKEGLKRLEDQERKRREEEALAERKLKVEKLLIEARKYTKERNVELATDTFQKIVAIDPENYEVSALKRDLKSWEDEKKRKELEESQKKAERERKVNSLLPSKSLYNKKDWFKAIAKLEEFLKITPMDEDLINEASEMLKVSKEQINLAVSPLLGKARSLQEGQDLKGAYEIYIQVLKFEPSNAEALNQTNEIKEQLTLKARKIYREAIISESLSLFQDAKEKFQEVQQISPVDSDYYKKATDKLKEYLE